MIRIRQSFGVHAGRVLEFDQEVVRFGRLPESDVPFDPKVDLDASGRHAEIRKTVDGFQLVDVGSRNGTFLNGENITQALLSDGDEIEFGIGGPRVTIEISGQSSTMATQSVTDDMLDEATLLAEPSSEKKSLADDGATSVFDENARTTATASELDVELARTPLKTKRVSAWKKPHALLAVFLLFCLVLAVGLFFYVKNQRQTELSLAKNGELKEAQLSPEQIEQRYIKAMFAIVEQNANKQVGLVCTAFAVRSDLLATAAHCLSAVEEAAARGSAFHVAPCASNNGPKAAIVRMWRHPEFMLSGVRPSANIGIVQVDRQIDSHLKIADAKTLAGLQAGVPLFLFAAGSIGEISSGKLYSSKLESLSEKREPKNKLGVTVLNYNAVLPPSAGGSPVLDSAGRVLGVHVASLGALVAGMAATERPTEGYTYGIRVDALQELLLGLGR
ncbi:MAG: FHA domain-containing protein [Myxococcales bacterium]|nr:MAG: FHA domain-containing protein [Myxococcales bacterium]